MTKEERDLLISLEKKCSAKLPDSVDANELWQIFGIVIREILAGNVPDEK